MSDRWDAWVKEKDSAGELERRMPLSSFMRMLPNWALAEIRAEDPAVRIHAVLLHESLWQDGEFLNYSNKWPAIMGVVAEVENQRRIGICRFTVEGEDRLLNRGKLTIELNPAIMGLVASEETGALVAEHKADPTRDISPAGMALHKKICMAAIASDWCDRAALEAP